MLYSRPQLIDLDAITAIQTIDTKLTPIVTDIFVFNPLYPLPTIAPAYEADE